MAEQGHIMVQNGPANRRESAQDQEDTFSIDGWFLPDGQPGPLAAHGVQGNTPPNPDESHSSIEISPGTEIDPFNWSNSFMRVYADFELLDQLAANLQNDFVIRKLSTMEDGLLAARAECDLLPLSKLRLRLEELQASHMYSSDRLERQELSEQLSMLRLNLCSQALVRIALAEFYFKVRDRAAAQRLLADAELRYDELTESSSELECVDYLTKVRSLLLSE